MRRSLPPLKAVVAFEAVTRIGSVTGAAQELGVTHSAVSKQLAVLEAWLGVPLFDSNRRHMTATPPALRLASAAGAALDLLASAIDSFMPDEASEVLDVIAPATFAMRWLMPRLPAFEAEFSHVDVRVRPIHTGEEWSGIPFDVVIRRGEALQGDLRGITLLREEIGLLARPEVAASLATCADLAGIRLLESVTRPGELARWLVAANMPAELAAGASRFGHFYIALEACLAGQGAIAAPIEVVSDLLTRGDLVEPFATLRVSGPEYRLGYAPAGARANLAASFAEWALRTVTMDSGLSA
ncbi:DNA-binding transcriptional LysR family regulator [Angulomicrobium tetraedrale]|uniref:DNA-binding transcriptional LysR family regulator n=1 Tax=Ancylobacter tetraedralis TaxID=217068 RepID=A0A839Z8U1_9HYPH|nr:LysR family transcriptional regulator [Ancylobacter tetraedralis]MBB3771266.1 DNA-binding transcriptional LysR family regulator [Ancylobacter tetraedralis]